MKKAPEHLRFAAMAVDAVVFSVVDGQLVVLIKPVASESAYAGQAAFIGGLIKERENADEAVLRVLAEKGGIKPAYFEQLYTFSAVDRDKRNRVVSVAYLAFVHPDIAMVYEHEDAQFVSVKKVSQLAYDHDEVLRMALKRLHGKIAYTNIAQFLLPRHFTLTELQAVYELILGAELDKRNFRKKILALALVKDTGKKQEGVKNRPAALYEFTNTHVTELPLLVG